MDYFFCWSSLESIFVIGVPSVVGKNKSGYDLWLSIGLDIEVVHGLTVIAKSHPSDKELMI